MAHRLQHGARRIDEVAAQDQREVAVGLERVADAVGVAAGQLEREVAAGHCAAGAGEGAEVERDVAVGGQFPAGIVHRAERERQAAARAEAAAGVGELRAGAAPAEVAGGVEHAAAVVQAAQVQGEVVPGRHMARLAVVQGGRGKRDVALAAQGATLVGDRAAGADGAGAGARVGDAAAGVVDARAVHVERGRAVARAGLDAAAAVAERGRGARGERAHRLQCAA